MFLFIFMEKVLHLKTGCSMRVNYKQYGYSKLYSSAQAFLLYIQLLHTILQFFKMDSF